MPTTRLGPFPMLMLIASSCLAGCASDPSLESKSWVYQRPEPASDGWPTASLAALQIDEAPIAEMMARIRSGEFKGISSVLLVRGGSLVLEEYFGEFGREDLHNMRSASKALTSALVGIAIDQGFIDSVDTPLLDYFPEYEGEIANWDDRKRTITLAQVLSMTAGMKCDEDAMYETDDWIKFYLDQPLFAPPGEAFSYATGGAVALGNVITKASGQRIPAFADRFLFGPLGITRSHWPITNSRGSQGLAMTGGGLSLRPRDMAKFGQLFLDGGVWNGQRLISEKWVRASTSKHATSDLYGEDFGYLWRSIHRQVKGQTIDSFEAWGNGGQFILVFPSLKLVAVFTGENYGLFPEMEQPFVMMDRFILPAMH